MSGISLDHVAALDALATLVADGEEQHQRHIASRPNLPASSAGRGFTDRGAAIATMLQKVHEEGANRLQAVRTTADAAVEQVRMFRDVDKNFSTQFSGQP